MNSQHNLLARVTAHSIVEGMGREGKHNKDKNGMVMVMELNAEIEV